MEQPICSKLAISHRMFPSFLNFQFTTSLDPVKSLHQERSDPGEKASPYYQQLNMLNQDKYQLIKPVGACCHY